MLALHVRTVHDTYGIAFGLTTTLAPDTRAVIVQPGLAYTCRGASVFVDSVTTIVAPHASSAGTRFDLVLVPANTAMSCGEPAYDCNHEPAFVSASLRWISAEPSRACACKDHDDAVQLGRFVRSTSGILAGPDTAQRRSVRGLVRPHIVSGVTKSGALVWQQGAPDLFAQVDTSAAGFTSTPVYLVSLAKPTPWSGGLSGPFISVGQSSPTHFNVHLIIAAQPPAIALIFAMMDAIKALTFSWTGVESTVGCTDPLFPIGTVPLPFVIGGMP